MFQNELISPTVQTSEKTQPRQKTKKPPHFLCVCLNPTIQKTIVFDKIEPGEVNRSSNWRIDAAGKGVIPTRILTQLGEKAIHLTQLGGPTRAWFLTMCAADGISVEWVESGAPIRFCTTLIEETEGRTTELVEESLQVAPETSDSLVERFVDLAKQADAVLLSGTVAAGIEKGTMARFARIAWDVGVHLYLDIKKQDLLECLEFHPVCAKPNLEELAQTLGIPYANVRDEEFARKLVEEQGRRFFGEYGTYLVVTRGAKSTLYWDGQKLCEYPVESVKVRNPIGSGDAFGAGLARILERHGSIHEAVAEGTRLGGLNAAQLKPGTLFS
ncbi:MAG TPA: PfkB family carbohydrate kinase [Rectinema sp.]|nr:PfkB family carbohydrate kinase [Rectinema sp.]